MLIVIDRTSEGKYFETEIERYVDKGFEHSVSTSPISSFVISDITYKFLNDCTLSMMRLGNAWICRIGGLEEYHGEGDTSENAYNELIETIHIEFQRLYRKRPFEQNEEERKRWKILANTIDLLHYKANNPISIRTIGCISYQKISRPARIKWIDGTNYKIDPMKVPGELMSCRPGQWIEAFIKIDPITQKIIKIESFQKIAFRIPTETQIEKYHRSLDTIPVQTVDWSE